jgi:TolB-like protein/Tfp pilus assembly protein PilF
MVAMAALTTLLWPTLGRRRTAGPASGPIRSIAVLPLSNLSGDPAQEYFSDGMTDELIATLGRLDGLSVISRTSVMQFKGSTRPLPEIAQALRVDAVLEGSVLLLPGSPAGEAGEPRRVRINARLIHAGADTQVWSRTFETILADALLLQNQVAQAVAEGIDLRLTSQQQAALTSRARQTVSNRQQDDAFDLYLRGRYYWNMRTEEGLKRSIQYFREALDRDPRYARAYAGLADAYSLLGVRGMIPQSEAYAQAHAAARQALQIDDSLAEAHASLALVQMERLEWDAAAASFTRALKLNPAYATGHHWYSSYLARCGRLPEALTEIDRALSLDPLSVSVMSQRGALLHVARRADDAINQLEKVLAMHPGYARAHMLLATAYTQKREYDRALAEASMAATLGERSLELRAHIGYIYALAGRRDDALSIASELVDRDRRSETGAAGGAAVVYAGLGDKDRAFEWLERARELRDPWIAYLKVDAEWDALRSDPRFQRLLASAGIPR